MSASTRRPEAMGEILYVLGMHRSGTSAVSRVLALCGANLPDDLLPPAGDNPTGFWESQRSVALNDAYLAVTNSSPYDPASSLQSGIVSSSVGRKFVAEITAFLRSLNVGALMLIKDPRISTLLPYWTAAAIEAGHSVAVVQIFRNPYEVARSLSVRQGMSAAHALNLWTAHNLVAERDARAFRRIFVRYSDLLSDWKSIVSRCVKELGLPLETPSEAEAAVDEFLSSELRHHRVGEFESAGCQIAETIAKGVYELLNDAVRNELDQPAFDEQVRLMIKSRPFLAEEATRESWRFDVGFRAAIARAEVAMNRLEHRVHSLDGAD